MLKISILSFLLALGACSSDQQEQALETEDLETTEDEESQEEDSEYDENYNQNGDSYEQGNDQYSNGNEYGNNEYNQNLNNQDFNEAVEGEYQEDNDQLFNGVYDQNAGNNYQSDQNADQNQGDQGMDMPMEEDMEEETMPMVSSIGDPNEFSGAPAVPGTLRVMAEGEAPEEYIVEYGDTLFDICSQLLSEGGYWPKLWSLNNYIKNPHFIWPGMRLRFYPGDEEDPPFIEIVQEEEVVPIADEEDVDFNALVQEAILPENETLAMQETEVVGRDGVEEGDDLFDTVGAPFNTNRVSVTLPGFIFAEENSAACTVVGGTMGEALVGEDRLFLCNPEEELTVGSTYTAVRYMGSVEDAESGDSVGHQYQFVSHVKMIRELDGGEKFIGLVTKSRLGLREGDLIIPYVSTKRTLSLSKDFSSPAVVDNAAHIVGFDLQGQQIGGQGSLVFLDKGANDGISNGQLMKIEQSLQYLLLTYDLEEPTQDTVTVGYVRIIDTTEVASVGYIIHNDHEVFIGDLVGKG
ncbi:MAG: LysM peptidoglycan-binding domain-containing protein [Oligoflexales bacterium]|nr:LysM peptidoglycan-binding domain-containing protein [Oligoflexales bacterium]